MRTRNRLPVLDGELTEMLTGAEVRITQPLMTTPYQLDSVMKRTGMRPSGG